MCGRFAQHLTGRQIHEFYQIPESTRPLHLHPRYNGAPVQDFAVCRLDADGSRALATLRWGLVPSWVKDFRRGARLINARAETVHDTPSFSAAFRARRCLVPANGWFEWQRTGHAKQPYFLALTDGSPLSFAALWEYWDRGVNGNRKPHICGNQKLHTSGEDVSDGADILPVMPVGRVGLDAGSGATGVLANTRREAAEPAVTWRLPHAVRPTLSSASADAPASGSCCPGC